MAEGIEQLWVSTPRGRHLRGRRKGDTRPEMSIRRALHAAGFRYVVSPEIASGCRPDIAFPGRGLLVFVDGCFWHGCPLHGTDFFRGPNQALWTAKLRRNRLNDARANVLALSDGYSVLRVWECSVTKSLTDVVGVVAERLVVGRSAVPRLIQIQPTP